MQHKKDLKRSLLALGMVALLAMTTAPTAGADGETASEVDLDGLEVRSGVFHGSGSGDSEIPMEVRPAGEFVFLDVFFANGTWRVMVSNTAPGGLPFMVHVDGIPEEWWGSTVTLAADELAFSVVAEGPLATLEEIPWIPGRYGLTITGADGQSLLQHAGMDLTSKPFLPDVEIPEPEELLKPRRTSHDNPCQGDSRTSYPENYCNQGSYQNSPGDPCYYYNTVAQPVSYGYYAWERDGTSTSAWALTVGNHYENWQYERDGSSASPTYVSDAYSFGHGFYGANQYVYGHEYDIGFGASIEGSKDITYEYNSKCRKSIAVGERFTAVKMQPFYRDTDEVVANHIIAWEKGRPTDDCTNSLNPILKAALNLNKYGGIIDAAIPDDWCTEYWLEIKTNALGYSGLGVETNRAAQNWYEGSEGFIRTKYSSTGDFKMRLDGLVLVHAWMNSCNTCYPSASSYWTGWDLAADGLVTT